MNCLVVFEGIDSGNKLRNRFVWELEDLSKT